MVRGSSTIGPSVTFSVPLAAKVLIALHNVGSSEFPMGDGVKIEAIETESDHDFESFGVPVTSCCVLDSLYPGVDPFAKSIRDSMCKVVEDLCQVWAVS